ncbi:MAG: hypothetical protein AB7S26_04080 [Sandaracinaceae bacterium]
MSPPFERLWPIALCVAGAALSWSTLPCAAHAQGARSYHALHIGVVEERRSSRDQTTRDTSTGVGGLAGLEMPVAPLLAIGGEGGATIWNLFASTGPRVMIHASVAPRLRDPWGNPGGVHGDLHLTTLFGPSLDVRAPAPSDRTDHGDASYNAWMQPWNGDVGMGFHVGALVGASIYPIPQLEVRLDAGYVHHVVWHGEERIDLGHLQLRTGLVVAI